MRLTRQTMLRRLRTPALVAWTLLSIWAFGFGLGLRLPGWAMGLVVLAAVSVPAAGLFPRLMRMVRGLVSLIRGVSREEITPTRRTSLAWLPARKWSTR